MRHQLSTFWMVQYSTAREELDDQHNQIGVEATWINSPSCPVGNDSNGHPVFSCFIAPIEFVSTISPK